MKNLIYLTGLILLIFSACHHKSRVRPDAPQDGLLFYCNFNDNLKDQQGYTPDGVKTGTPAFVNGREGKALSIQAGGQKVSFTPTTPQTSTVFSVSFWLKNNIVSPDQKFLKLPTLFFASTSNGEQYYAGMNATGIISEWNVNAWNHIVMVKDANTLKFYLNGELKKSQAPPPPADVIVGFDGMLQLGSIDSDFTGIFDELYVYHRALSDTEVKTLYQRGL
jgi:hypothetical protein